MKIDFSPITPAQWSSLDNHAIAKRMRCTPASVARKRAELDLPPVRKSGSGRKACVKLERFDLTLTNKENAERLHITPQRAGQIRKQLLKPREEWI